MELSLPAAGGATPAAGSGAFTFAICVTAGAYYALAFLGLFSEADAALFLVACSFTSRRLRPFLLLLAASVQDAPGSSYLWTYVGFVAVATLTVADEMLHGPQHAATPGERALERVVVMAIAVVAYATLASGLQQALGGYSQSAERPFPFVGGLMCAMIFAGFFARRGLDRCAGDRRRLGGLAVVATLHALLIGILQIPLGQEFYRSSGNLAQVEMSQQLMEAGALGFARINGPFLSPNAFGYTMLLLATVSILTLFDTARVRVFFLYIIVGFAAVLLSMSKALLGYYGLVCVVLLHFVASRGVKVLVYGAGLLFVGWFLTSEYFQLLLEVFRVQEGALGSRQYAWLAVIERLQPVDWVFGIGLSAWPTFFATQVGVPLSDPHSLPLSVVGTFGLLGVVFYLCLVWTLLRRAFADGADNLRRLGVYLLLLLFFVKDLVSIPAVLGNTPLTFMIWLLLGLVLVTPQPTAPPESP